MFCVNGACVTLGWYPSVDTNVVGYVVYYGTISGTYTERIDVGDQTSATITGLTAGVTYYFAVTAYAATSVESVPSNEVAYTVPLPATNQVPRISRLTLTADGVALDWTTVAGRSYRVACKENLGDGSWVAISRDLPATDTVLHWLDTNSVTNKQRFYSVVMLP
jgi:Fibronectin type III domain